MKKRPSTMYNRSVACPTEPERADNGFGNWKTHTCVEGKLRDVHIFNEGEDARGNSREGCQ